MIEHSLSDTISLLTRTPAALNALLRDLPETWTLRNEGANTWSPFDILGHLIHAERADWIPRVHVILKFGETQAFAPFDRGGNPNPYLDENVVPLHLSDAQKKALLAFLRNGLAGTVRDGASEHGKSQRNP